MSHFKEVIAVTYHLILLWYIEKFCKQVDGVAMQGTIFLILSDCFMNKMERDIFIPLEPKFCKHLLSNTYRSKMKKTRV